MKKLLMVLMFVPVLGVGAAAVNFYVVHPKLRAAPPLEVPNDPETVERGRYLSNHILGCVQCHSPIDEMRPGDFPVEGNILAGREFPVMPEMFPGRLVAPNLTPDEATGVGGWSDGELARAIREGVSRDGRPLFPMMNYAQYRHLTDDDTEAVIAYLRSVPAVNNELPATEIDFPVSMFIRTAPAPLADSPAPWPSEPLARGQRLLAVMGCVDCHTPMERGAPVEGMHLAGGNRFGGPFGTVYASNITSSAAAGIGAYTDDDLRRVFREGVNKAGESLWVMPWSATQGMTDGDIDALITALRTVPENNNLVPAKQLRTELAETE